MIRAASLQKCGVNIVSDFLSWNLEPATTQNLVVMKFAVEFWWRMLLTIFLAKKLENLLPNFAGSSPPISPKTSPTSLWKSLVLRNLVWNFGEIFRVLHFCRVCVPESENFTKFQAKNGVEYGKFHPNFTLLQRTFVNLFFEFAWGSRFSRTRRGGF